MSQIYGPLTPAEIETTLRASYIDSYVTVASSVIVIYDHLTTLAREHEFMWGRKFSSVTLLFCLNRWTTFIWALTDLALEFTQFTTATRNANWFGAALSLVLFAVWADFITQFVWFETYKFAIIINPYLGMACVYSLRVTLAFFDGDYHEDVLYSPGRHSIRVQDTTCDYVVKKRALLCLNLLVMLGHVINFFVYASEFATPLRQANDLQTAGDDAWHSATRSGSGTTSESGSLRFASFIDNMGELLGHDDDYDDDKMHAMDPETRDPKEASAPGGVVDIEVDVVTHPPNEV
ncbi:hypothetical protein CERSUDRAFT_71364 [Gelatoporia subvermispora B]|uniref:DUF6533 domain-containing protein n=1 Tax=Ceriporiopsis subvermispora (strain B) TaxID=914234 RepID=M2RLW0_CERS8|nr:hypothetical protein CERSUDRAFT_71364 [Gelatoporia subvermispora B]